MSELVHLNGELVAAERAAVSVFDAGLLHGASAFTTMLARNGVVFRLARHMERLFDTVQVLGLRTDATPETLSEAVGELLRANSLSEARVRITLTPGSVRGDSEQHAGTTLITAEPFAPADKTKGLTVIITSLRQGAGDPTYGFKTGCYLPRVLARRQAAAKGADEALWFTADNRLAESCFANVFLVSGGKLFTPPRNTPVLPGITRQAVMELAGELGIACDESAALTIKDLLGAQEVFLTSAVSGIRPVARIERHAVGDERPGPFTRRLMEAYDRLVERETRPPQSPEVS